MLTLTARQKLLAAIWFVSAALLFTALPLHAQHVGATLPAGTAPWAVAVNPVTNKIYVANRNSNNVTVINGAS